MEIARVVPTGLFAALSALLAWREHGSIDASDWLGYAVVGALIVAVAMIAIRPELPSRLSLIGVAFLLGLAGWDAVSLTWSALPSLARDEALLVAFYAVALLTPMVTLRRTTERELAVGVMAAVLALLAVGTAVILWLGERASSDYTDGRLTFPISYVNAEATLALIGFWPVIGFAALARSPPWLRALALGSATAFLGIWLLTQSKGGGLALAASGLLLFSTSRERLRLLVPTLIGAGLVGAAYLPTTGPFRARGTARFDAAVHSAGRTVLLLSAAAVGIGFVYALLDRRLVMSPRSHLIVRRIVATAFAAVAVASIAAFFVRVDRPGDFFQREWRSFKTLPAHERGSSHLVSIGSNRYDFWRVDLHDLSRHPVAGIGARGFGPSYLRQRRSGETPARGHSLEFDTLSETGIIGFFLLAAGVGLPMVCAARTARRWSLGVPVLAAAAYWVIHASADWIWTFPAVGLPFFLLLGIGCSEARRPALLGARVRLLAVAVAMALALFAFAPPWLAARYTTRALHVQGSPTADIDRARRLDPLSIKPLVAEAALATTPQAAIPPLREAVAKQPRDASLHYLLGRAYLAARHMKEARRELLRAASLDPADEIIQRALSTTR